MVEFCRDANRGQFKEAFRLSDQGCRALVENLSEIIFYLDAHGHFAYVSPAMERLGLDAREMIGQPLSRYTQPDDLTGLRSYFERTLTGDLKPTEFRFISKDNTVFYMRISASPLWDEGNFLGWTGILSDMTADQETVKVLKNAVEDYMNFIEEAPMGFCVTDLTGNIEFVNRYIEEVTGWTREELIGKNGLTVGFFNEETQRKLLERLAARLAGDHHRTMEIPVFSKDGRSLWADLKTTILKKDGVPLHLQLTFTDITERRRTEEMLRESEAYYKTIFENSGTAIGIADEDATILNGNSACEKFTGYTKAEIIGKKKWTELVAPADVERLLDSNRRRLAGESNLPTSHEIKFITKSGAVKDTILNVAVITGMKKVAVSFLDVTERRRAEEALRQSEGRYRQLVEDANDIIFRADVNGHFSYINPVALRITGYEEAEFIGRHFREFIRADQRDEVDTFYRRQFQKGIPNTYYEVAVNTKDGREIWFGQSVQLLRSGGRISGMQAVARDITDRRQAQDRANQTLETLRNTLRGTIQAMSVAVSTRDPYTADHQKRVADLARAIAKEMKLDSHCIDGIRLASMIHDIGKISVPAEILSRPTKLTEIEFRMVEEHPQAGYDILKSIDFPWPIARMVLEHHERMDGSGYPNGLTGEHILMESRILALADVVEAICSHRPYRPALGVEVALQEIEINRGILYDRDVVDACSRLFREKGFELIC